MPKFVFQQSKMPAFNSPAGKRLAKHLWDFKDYLNDHRRERELYVRECDEAYLCKRYVPDTGGIQLLEDGEFGESDVHDNAQIISIRASLSLMDRSAPWLRCGSKEDDAVGAVEALEDYNLFMHKKARTRRQVQRTIKQGYVRGSMYLYFDWEDRYRLRRVAPSEHATQIDKLLIEGGLSPKEARRFTRARQQELIYSGPVITPVDFYDVWVEPFCDIVNPGERPATIMQRFRSKARLMAELDDFDKPVYSNLNDVEEWPMTDLMGSRDFMGYRMASERIFGNNTTQNYQSKAQLVPVYQMHFPYLKFEDQEYWDTYFYVALSYKGNTPTLIRVEENPNDLGMHHLIMDHYEDWFTPTPYGISPTQFQLSKYHQKNLLQLLMITGAAHTVFPPNLVWQDAFRDDEELSFFPGNSISVMDNRLGLDVVRQLPMPASGTMLGSNILRFMGEELRSISGVDGLVGDSGARTSSKSKTATEITRDTHAGSAFLDNLTENLTEGLLNDLVQGVFQLAQVNAIPSKDRHDCIEYEKYLSDKVIEKQLELKDLRAKRSIQVIGQSGMADKEQETNNLLKAFEITGQMQDPRVMAARMIILNKLCVKFNAPLPPELMMTPAEAVASNPEVQIAAIQAAAQNPEIQQLIMQVVQEAVAQGGGMPGEPQQGPPGPPPQQGAGAPPAPPQQGAPLNANG